MFLAAEVGEQTDYQITTDPNMADIVVINSCSVTQEAEKSCHRWVRQLRRKNPSVRVMVLGCYAQLKPKEIASWGGVERVLGNQEKFRLVDYLSMPSVSGESGEVAVSPLSGLRDFHGAFSSPGQIGARTRAFLKVQDGCDYGCTFCTIPLSRGGSRSSGILEVRHRVQKLLAKGVREIVFTGVNLGDFGRRKGSRVGSLLDLIRDLDSIDMPARFRLSSVEPNLLHDEIINCVASSRHWLPHFHLPLQSGQDRTLKRMRRRYLTQHYEDRIGRIKEEIPHACIGADVMVGFPGETPSD
ncbi:MAG: MiaB/RimO family radical SAM methylthiotransferase, partial [Cytophagales bacterium]|nr:MiaB/RimO family radical SAM methylthiotransferase [Cytophagales bacterium]